ncbi:hypothetical protein VEx25_A1349 [Vibrio antiquarius]|uniref:Uncharacterized protein n=1 Tax=Vibrio antiquarius (strain Ex25) TaxID=150340 RepID=A0ABM9WZE5_VIBAE|nr:hypothetical protein VEx25_A1349 [Vibrio antiquarius]EMD77844.1 hypothetical protein C408_3749 [Vibrio diabolicus E0666]
MFTIHTLNKIQPTHSCHNVQPSAIAALAGQALYFGVDVNTPSKV